MDFTQLLNEAAEMRASDVFLKENTPPAFRLAGRIVLSNYPALTNHDVRRFAQTVMTPEAISRFERDHELDIAFTIPGLSRFRANMYQQRGSWAIVLRLVPLYIQSMDDLRLPAPLRELTHLRQGLVLVTGPTGSGKSTTLAAMIDEINSNRHCNIVTVEDPIEFVHADKLAIVSQREVGVDTESFTEALKSVVRQSPDVILIGEMRDTETMTVALAAAETGHLVFSTVHTSSSAETIDRIINMFPPHAKNDVCTRMAKTTRGVISQKLVPCSDGMGREAAVEIMLAGPTVSKLIEEGRSGSLYQAIAEDRFYGMQTMNEALLKLMQEGRILEEDALAASPNHIELKQMMRRKDPSTNGKNNKPVAAPTSTAVFSTGVG